jgi:hypothetical protein
LEFHADVRAALTRASAPTFGSRIPPAALRHADPECRLGFGAFVFVCRPQLDPDEKAPDRIADEVSVRTGARGVCVRVCICMYR